MPIQSVKPPPGAKSIDQILDEARLNIQRLTPSRLYRELQELDPGWGLTHLVDICPAAQRANEGTLTLTLPKEDSATPKSDSTEESESVHKVHIIERNVLEWRLDPQSDAKVEDIVGPYGYDMRVVVVCSEGYTSSLAASEL
ncbi:hypothetical protein P154DRAFT_583332 [Amniculicola lignicola CBS 123094]|uniref:Rhodanese domain-containing protein n=1 Tax=Amniculicola lignicola CBS 123094 TaxID=1392246 RepID=A0A6A5VYG7_9PLEO|nr:hypothetical protein P154DRAFT_583332 [Amniculicola lignicola CBS 123094]